MRNKKFIVNREFVVNRDFIRNQKLIVLSKPGCTSVEIAPLEWFEKCELNECYWGEFAPREYRAPYTEVLAYHYWDPFIPRSIILSLPLGRRYLEWTTRPKKTEWTIIRPDDEVPIVPKPIEIQQGWEVVSDDIEAKEDNSHLIPAGLEWLPVNNIDWLRFLDYWEIAKDKFIDRGNTDYVYNDSTSVQVEGWVFTKSHLPKAWSLATASPIL